MLLSSSFLDSKPLIGDAIAATVKRTASNLWIVIDIFFLCPIIGEFFISYGVLAMEDDLNKKFGRR